MKFTFYPAAVGLAGRKGHDRHARSGQHSPGSVRADADDSRRDRRTTGACGYGNDFFAREFWRFVLVQQQVAKLAETAIDYPPMQDPASFNLSSGEEEG